MTHSAKEAYEFDTVSASQLKRFDRCHRKWFFTEVLKYRFPPTDAMLRSRKLHADIESVLADGEGADNEEVAELLREGLTPLPDQIGGVEASIKSAGLEVEDVRLTGIIDTYWTTPERDVEAVVNDWKFRSYIDKYDNEEDINEGFQLNIYGAAVAEFLKLSDSDQLELRLTESLKTDRGGPDTNVISVKKSVGDIREKVESFRFDILDMKAYASERLAHVEPDRSACYDYGSPCDHKDLCEAVPFEPIKNSQLQGKTMVDVDGLIEEGKGGSSDEESEPEPETTTHSGDPASADDPKALKNAKREWQESFEAFDGDVDASPWALDDYDLTKDQKREFIRWRSGQRAALEGEADRDTANKPDETLEASDVFGAITSSVKFSDYTFVDQTDSGMLLEVEGYEVEVIEDAEEGWSQLDVEGTVQSAPAREAKALENWLADTITELDTAEEPDTNDSDAPHTAPDQKSEQTPTGPDEIAISDWDWDSVPNIGSKGKRKIVDWLEKNTSHKTLADLLDSGFNLERLPGVGESTASKAHDRMKSESVWTPSKDEGERDVRGKQEKIAEARRHVQAQGYDWSSDLINESDVEASDSPEALAQVMVSRIEVSESESDDIEKKAKDAAELESGADSRSKDSKGLRLYINCRPVKGDECTELNQFLHEEGFFDDAAEFMVENFDVDTDPEYVMATPFGRGAQSLAGAVMRRADEFDGRAIYVDDKAPGAEAVIQALIPRADVVIKG